jgi:hypothetical protein
VSTAFNLNNLLFEGYMNRSLRNEIRRAKHNAALTLPALPAQGPAVFRSSRDPIFIETRRRALENYLITLSSILYGT